MDLDKRFGLDGRVALVTGASSGLGRHFAKVLAAAGARVVVAARRLPQLEELAAAIGSEGGVAKAVRIDVTEPASVTAAFEEAEAAFGPVGVLVNNAGIPAWSYFLETTDEEWRKVLDVNLDGVFRVGREGATRMKRHGVRGSIINVASVLGVGVLKALSPYLASKAAVIQLTKAMALELARDGIRVNALAPGYFATELNAEFLAGPGAKLRQKVPMARFGEMAELDGPLLLLASDAGSYMTGATLVADGGTLLSIG